ncbi:MAG: hypothetical protein NC122_09705 [Faecalibacterium sp.]|nr:hypothetical protein [Ruminococcus sp.]MCM1392907.1 hypothetical protein [Ruminococcus sp.]MCM1486465.1 hypothetical protein [Faecalibacterium sp.]
MSDIILATLIMGGFFALCIAMIVHGFKLQWKKDKASEKYDAKFSASMSHVSGLDLHRNAAVEVYYGRRKITFVSGNREFIVRKSKITNVELVTGNKGLEQAAGAAIGAIILGGVTGAAIGMAGTNNTFMVIAYESVGKTKQIVLDIGYADRMAKKMVKDFAKNNVREIQTVEL